MPELILTILIVAALVWLAHRREQRAHDAGVREGYALAEQNAARRQERLEQNR